jgi:glycosyltransferase involved in cell wall biosynthesis
LGDGTVGVIGIGLFDEPSGITRAIQTIIDYFGRRAVLIVDNLQALETHPVRDARLYRVRSPRLRKSLFLRRLVREPLWLIRDYIQMLIDLSKVFDHERVDRMCFNTAIQFLGLSPFLFMIKLLRRDIKVTLLVYDPIEPAWCRRNPLVRFLLSSGFLTDLITVDSSMRSLLQQLTRRTPVYAIRFGVSADLVERAGEDPDHIRDRIGSSLPTILSKDKESVIVLYYGRVIARRRLEDLIAAFSELRKATNLGKTATLYIGGYTNRDVSYVEELKTLAAELECEDRLRFLGTLTTDELAYLYHSCDIFVFPAVQQPWGLAPLEAMAFGKPVIITDDCGLSQILRPSKLATISRGKDPEDLATKIETLLTNENRRCDLGKAGKAFVEQNLTFYQTGTQLEKCWRMTG